MKFSRSLSTLNSWDESSVDQFLKCWLKPIFGAKLGKPPAARKVNRVLPEEKHSGTSALGAGEIKYYRYGCYC